MDKRTQKRWKREHGKRTLGQKVNNLTARLSNYVGGSWKFHEEQWGYLRVLVLPKTDRGIMGIMQVSDSNSGIVTSAPDHGTLLGHLIVNNGSKPDADQEAINQVMTGDRNKDWKTTQPPGFEVAHCLPRRRVEDSDRNETYWMAVDSMKEGQRMTTEQAISLADQILGWSPDSIDCSTCGLVIHGFGGKELIDQAREYDWSILLNQEPNKYNSWLKCPACSPFPHPGPIPSWEDLCKLIPGLEKE